MAAVRLEKVGVESDGEEFQFAENRIRLGEVGVGLEHDEVAFDVFGFRSDAFGFRSDVFGFQSEAFRFRSDAFVFQSDALGFQSDAALVGLEGDGRRLRKVGVESD